jgi:hypothetical protein
MIDANDFVAAHAAKVAEHLTGTVQNGTLPPNSVGPNSLTGSDVPDEVSRTGKRQELVLNNGKYYVVERRR